MSHRLLCHRHALPHLAARHAGQSARRPQRHGAGRQGHGGDCRRLLAEPGSRRPRQGGAEGTQWRPRLSLPDPGRRHTRRSACQSSLIVERLSILQTPPLAAGVFLRFSKIDLASRRLVTAPPGVYLHRNIDGDSTMKLTGIHHLTAVTANAPGNHAFYTQSLGMRLVKKTVNQDDVSAYHLFYADGRATPGSDVTFFDWPLPRERRGTHSIVRTGLRVASDASLRWWNARFN